ncbi:hypothetical protein K438DRAFT_1811654 [Mycena galopus ATCC 62051]|nr:hypothetical protein K438DRAFT_1811654 [Mycena galopus ATCC 62051]
MSPMLHLILELLATFCASSLIVLGLLRGFSVQFPLLRALEVTFVCTLIVFAAIRAAGCFGSQPIDREGRTLGDEETEGSKPLKFREKDTGDFV